MTKRERFLTIQNRIKNPNRPINECFWDAKRWIHFTDTLKADIKAAKRRTAAAKKGWKKRRAA